MEDILTSDDIYLLNAKKSIMQYERTREYEKGLQQLCTDISCEECILQKERINHKGINSERCSRIQSNEQRYQYFLDYVKHNSFTDNIYSEDEL
jgi:hypothetical protein